MLYCFLRPLSAFFFLAVLVVALFHFASPAEAQTMEVRPDVRHDVSPPLADLMKNAPASAEGQNEADEIRIIPHPPGFKPADEPDPVRQPPGSTAGAPPAAPASLGPTLLLNFDGIGQGTPPGFNDCCAPPDTNGAVGLTQYVQWVNVSFAIFSKSDGSLLAGPSLGNSIWTGFGGDCETTNSGDPIVIYDKLANRWIFTQLAFKNLNGPFSQCTAVSTTSDAKGPYNRYQFGPYTTSGAASLNDYPKLGVWPDAYYITYNMFFPGFLGARACAWDRNAMLNGTAAQEICFQQPPTVGGVLPSDLDGHTPPPAGAPNYMLEFDVNSLNLYKFHVDFATPANSTFTKAANIPVAPFTPLCPNTFSCVPQQGTTTMLDSLGDRLMYRLAYRNFGDHESLVVNHSVVADPVNQNSGIRWYEIQNPGGTPTVAQQSTFAPDANFRWMGSVAMDQAGDLAVGYSVSSSNMFPSIAVAARLATDPPNTLQTPEIGIMTGAGSQTNNLTRWGDYSAMQVDPVDDCTFWYTSEYLKNTGSFNWNTRINTFKFDSCDKPDMTIAVTHSGNFTQGDTNKTYTITVTNSGGQPTDGSTVTVTDTLPPSGLTATAITGTGWSCSLGTLICTRSDVLQPKGSYPVITLTVNVSSSAPGFVTNTATVAGGGEQNTSNDTSNDLTTIIQTGPDPTIAKTHTGTFTQGQTGTYTITVTNVGLAPLDGSTVTVTDTLPTGLSASTASGSNWTCTPGTPTTTCTHTGALASNASYEPITLTVNVASNAPLGVAVNTATVAGGGDVNTLNDTANDPTTIIPPPPDLTITKSHTGNFVQGFAAIYNLTANNIGLGPTKGTVTVVDTLPTGITIIAASGSGWGCSTNLTTMTCTRSDVLAASTSYPTISLNVNVAGNAPPSVTNTATVSGGGEINTSNDTASDPTTINPAPSLAVVKSHTGNFTVGQTGNYTITVTDIGSLATNGTAVTVNDSLPVGMTATTINATGWSCSSVPTTFVSCSRSDVLASNNSYPPIVLTVSVDGNASPSVINFATATGGGDANGRIASDPTTINVPDLTIAKTHNGNFVAGEQGAVYTITVSNVGSFATGGGTVVVNDFLPSFVAATAATGNGWTCTIFGPQQVNCTQPAGTVPPGGSYPPITLTANVSNISLPTTVVNIARVSGIGDANPANNTAFDSTQIVMPVSLTPASPTTVTITAGTAATFSFTANLSTNPPVGNVNLNAALLPPNSKATFSSSTINQSGTVTLTIDTSGNGHVASLGPSRFGPSRFGQRTSLFAAMFFALVALFSVKRGKRRSSRPWLLAGVGASALVLALAFVGCGGHSTPPPPPVITPPGTYSVTMTATSSNNGVPGATVPLTVIVK
jgi:uncharacterized repeat protein (TIGR01451 family)